MEEFIPANVIKVIFEKNGDVRQIINNGKQRIIKILENTVIIKDKNGKEIYKTVLPCVHPLILNTIQYKYVKGKLKSDLDMSRKLITIKRRMKARNSPDPSQCKEDYFKLE